MLVGSLIRPPDQTYDTYMYLIQTKNEINTITMKHQTDIFYHIITDQSKPSRQFSIRTKQKFLEIIVDHVTKQIIDFVKTTLWT